MANQTPLSSNKLPLLLIFFTVFIDLIGFGIIIPLLPTYAEHFGASGATIGLLLMSYSLMQFIFIPVWGRLSDKVGRRPMLLWSLAASAAGYLIWGFSGSLLMLFLSRIVAGFGNANLAVAQAYIADITDEENRSKGMGIVGAAFGLGFVLGPAIGGGCFSIAHQLGGELAHHAYGLAGFTACAFSLIDFVLTALYLPEPKNRTQAGHDRFDLSTGFFLSTLCNPKLVCSLAIFFISTFAFSNMEATLVLLTADKLHFDESANGWMFTYVGLLMVLVQGGMIHRLTKKYGEPRLIMIGSLLVAVGLVLTPVSLAVSWSVIALAVALALLAIGSGINNPSNQSLISKLAPKEKVGGVLGVGQSVSTLGRILGPIVGGFAYQYYGAGYPYFIGAAAMLVAFALSFALPKLLLAPKPVTESDPVALR